MFPSPVPLTRHHSGITREGDWGAILLGVDAPFGIGEASGEQRSLLIFSLNEVKFNK